VFGCLAHVLVPKVQRTSKFQEVAVSGMLVGYAPFSQAWQVLVYENEMFRVHVSKDVLFDEHRTNDALCALLREHEVADVV
jgi:hypothetical protein